ncbi:hypothetical protein ABGT15_04750 [Flavobacterium enshiense]|uniref:hypothetical protein n=1 Tax=Flavobacterium enshiense TaxID=1341165 RepID=UPI00345DAB59
MKQTKETLKTYFETGDKPTQRQFTDLIDSFITEPELIEIQRKNSEEEHVFETLNYQAKNGDLVIGQKYILSDYQTKYYIEGSSSANIEKEFKNQSLVSGYGFFDPPIVDVVVGNDVFVTSLPSDYTGTIQVGDKVSMTSSISGYYVKFANNFHNIIGATFKCSLKRYDSIDTDATILDSNSKVVMCSNGVINTDVHDGTAYMDMSANENKAVLSEILLLTAISNYQFSPIAESITYPGEILEYDFTDQDIKNDNGKIIGSRNGLITRRISADKKIDIDKDWRVQRYRRYKMSETDWKNYLLNNSQTPSLYYLGSNHALTAANINTRDDHKYLLPYVDVKNFFQDFSKMIPTENPFIKGTTNPGYFVYGDMMEKTDDNAFKFSVTAATSKNAKDFYIFPMSTEARVDAVIVKKLENTVFLNYNAQYTSNDVIDVKITDSISESTFCAGAIINSSSGYRINNLSKITAIDNLRLRNSGYIKNMHVLATSIVNNSGDLQYVTVAGMAANASPFGMTYIDVSFDALCSIRNTMIGGKRVDRMTFSNVKTNKCLFAFTRGQYLRFADSIMYLTATMMDCDYYTNTIILDTTGPNDYLNKKAYGYWYSTNSSLTRKRVIINDLGEMVYHSIDSLNQNASKYLTYTSPK